MSASTSNSDVESLTMTYLACLIIAAYKHYYFSSINAIFKEFLFIRYAKLSLFKSIKYGMFYAERTLPLP